MSYFTFDLRETVKVAVMGREHLIPPTLHCQRKIKCYVLYFVTQGKLTLMVNDEPVELLPGDIYIFNRHDVQQPNETSDCEYFFVHFDGDKIEKHQGDYIECVRRKNLEFIKASPYSLERYDNFNISVRQHIQIKDKNNIDYLVEKFRGSALAKENSSIRRSFELCANFTAILIRLEKICERNVVSTKRESQTYNTVRKIADYINKNYNEDINGEMVEKLFSINYDYANRIFKGYLDVSIIRYRNERRIDRAKFLLSATEKSIEEISSEIGFEDKYYFSRLFTKLEGISPLAYRNK
ncbi:MAG: helix-turn-helix domain-containing protein [Ruminococcaceae bacterium]|nr:helix-turn-helix domain-containing protein [Oscillospiraceae bacterium]